VLEVLVEELLVVIVLEVEEDVLVEDVVPTQSTSLRYISSH